MEPNYVVGINPYIYEFINFSIVLLCTAVAISFTRYLVAEYHTSPRRFDPPRLYTLRHQMAMAIIFFLVGEAGLRGWSWYARLAGNVGTDANWMQGLPQVVPIGFGLMECVGLMCLVRIFAPDEWKYYSWGTGISIVILMTVRYIVL